MKYMTNPTTSKDSLPPMAKSPSIPKTVKSLTSIPNHKNSNMWKPSPPPRPKNKQSPIMIPKILQTRPPRFKATLPEPPLPPPATAAAAIQRRLVPRTGLTTSILRHYSDDEVDAEFRHLGISFTWTTRKFGKTKKSMIIMNRQEK